MTDGCQRGCWLHHECGAGWRSRRHHFISSRLTEWALTHPLPSPKKKSVIRSGQSRLWIPLGTTTLLKGWGLGCGSGCSGDWFGTWLYKSAGPEPRYLLGDSHLTDMFICLACFWSHLGTQHQTLPFANANHCDWSKTQTSFFFWFSTEMLGLRLQSWSSS